MCLLQPLEVVIFANLCRRLSKKSTTSNGKLVALEDIVAATGGAVQELEVEGLVATLKASSLRLFRGGLIRHKGRMCFLFPADEDKRVRKAVADFGTINQ